MSIKYLNEDFLHYIWKFKKFDFSNLRTLENIPIGLLDVGHHNHDSGPDFSNAKIKIGNTIWHGHVEIHLKSSDWYAHGHHEDPAYNNVILHVVFHHDKNIKSNKGSSISTLELKKRIDIQLIDKFRNLRQSESWIPCQNSLSLFSKDRFPIFMQRLLIERIQTKKPYIDSLRIKYKGNWDEICYHILLRYLGNKVNNDSFQRLAELTPFHVVRSCKGKVFLLEALFFGQSGLLNSVDAYSSALAKEYKFLKRKFRLRNMQAVEWKFFRLRPSNFPTIKIAQISSIISKNSSSIWSGIKNSQDVNQMKQLFESECSDYWVNHFNFGKESLRKNKNLGKHSLNSLLINALIPLLFYYADFRDDQTLKEKVLEYLEDIGPENNKIIRKWTELGLKASTAGDSQALLQLKNEYCSNFKCMHCEIGNQIMKS